MAARTVRRLKGFLVLALLLLATPAGAACGWVLWFMPSGLGGVAYPMAGYESLERCEGEVSTVQREKPAVYTCLPDTIDPRGGGKWARSR